MEIAKEIIFCHTRPVFSHLIVSFGPCEKKIRKLPCMCVMLGAEKCFALGGTARHHKALWIPNLYNLADKVLRVFVLIVPC